MKYHPHHRPVFAPLALVCAVLALATAEAELQQEGVVRGLSAPERESLEALTVLGLPNLRQLQRDTSAERLRERAQEIYELGVPSIGERPVDAEGYAPIHRYLLETFTELAPYGLELVGSLDTEVMAPVDLANRVSPEAQRREASVLEVSGVTLPVKPLYPNGAMPSLTPQGGLTGPLVYVQRASWKELEGLTVEGAIAVMDFGGGRSFERLFELGAKAVIVLEDEFVGNRAAEGLLLHTPFPYVRFYLGAEHREAILAQSTRKTADGVVEVMAEATLRGGNLYEPRPVHTFFTYLPPTDPVVYEVTEDSLLRFLARRNGLNPRDISEVNELSSPRLQEGQELLLPGGRPNYVVGPNDLARMVADAYSVDLETLQAANPGLALPLAPGDRVTVPNAEGPVTIFAPIDGNSIVPGMPHGGHVAGNLAIALTLLEHLATAPEVVRRRGVLFAFTDGDTQGGMASRLFAEYVMLVEGRLGRVFGDDAEAVIARYEAGLPFFEGNAEAVSSDATSWLVRDWLTEKIESVRIAIATERIPFRVALQENPPEDEIEGLVARVAELEDELYFLVELRDTTLQGAGSFPERLQSFREAASTTAAQGRLAARGISLPKLAERFRRELRQEVAQRTFHENNLAVTADVLNRINPSGADQFRLGLYFDFSSETPTARIVTGGEVGFRLRQGIKLKSNELRRMESRFQEVLAVASVRAGWPQEYAWVADKDKASFPSVGQKMPAVYDEFWLEGDIALVPVGTANARLERIDTPWDTFDRIDFENLSVLARSITTLVKVTLENVNDGAVSQSLTKTDMGQVVGQIVEFNIRSGIDANAPVPGTYVWFPAIPKEDSSLENSLAYRGFRRGMMKQALLNGSYRIPVETVGYNTKPRIYAYKLNEETALFERVANEGQVGTQQQSPEFKFVKGEEVEKKIVLSELTPRVIFPGTDPHQYEQVGGRQRVPINVEIIDAVRDGEPRNQAQDNPFTDYREKDVAGIVIYGEPESRLRMIVQRGLDYRMLLVGELRTEDKGNGYFFGPEDGERNITLPFTQVHIAEDMTALARYRLDLYRNFGITSKPLDEAVSRAEEKVAQAQEALVNEEWQNAVGLAREAWGIHIKYYPRVLKLGREAVFSVILVMAFLVPGAYFLERLVLRSRGVIGQLVGTGAIFTTGTLLLNFFHPAFQIALSPFIVVIAFVMILMSVIVLSICYQRFDVLVRRARMQAGQVESEEISLMSSLSTALSLGVSNLRKRMARTVLTTLTVSVLTFSIVAFVAVTGGDNLIFERLELDTFLDGEQVEPDPPNYEGILFRKFNWQQLTEAALSARQTEFGSRYEVTARAHYIEQEGGNQADREGVNQIPVTYQDREYVLTAIMAFQPNETEFSQLHRTVSHEHWFRGEQRRDGKVIPPDRNVVILPDGAAEALGITAADLVDSQGQRLPNDRLPEVLMSSRMWRVIGIMNTAEADLYRDVNGKSLALVDYLRSAMNKNVAGRLEEEGTSYHLSWQELAAIPLEAYQDVDARLRSVAVKLPENEAAQAQFFQDLQSRVNDPVFAYTGEDPAFLRTRESVDVSGIAKIILPIILCVLIVMNTMMGTVDERKGEVSMLGAIGLSPKQISFLLLSEATVYSILGIVFGIFAGLFFANFVPWINLQGIEFLPNLSLNFTSLTSMLLAMGTGVIVLLATLLPASKAAALAAPSGMSRWELPEPEPGEGIRFGLPFTLTRGNAIGMLAFFEQYLLNHTETTSPDFNCRDIAIVPSEEVGNAFEITCQMWLSPYDLDVAQKFRLRIASSAEEGIFAVTILLDRTSGSEENWLRTNYQFLNLVRKQFLIWRNLKPELRVRYIEQGAQTVREALSSPAQV